MPDNQSAVPVSQRAREAAASIWRWRGDYSTANDTAAGRADNSNFVKTFAAFESECAAEVEALRAENVRLQRALRHISTMRPAGDVATATGTRALVQRMEATAIQALNDATDQEAE